MKCYLSGKHINFRKIINKKESDEFGEFYWCPYRNSYDKGCSTCDGIIGDDNHMWRLFQEINKIALNYRYIKKYVLNNQKLNKFL